MAYRLTPAHAQAIAQADAILHDAGIARYSDLMQGAARLLTGLRENDRADIQKGKDRLNTAMETLRNETADPRPLIEPRRVKTVARSPFFSLTRDNDEAYEGETRST